MRDNCSVWVLINSNIVKKTGGRQCEKAVVPSCDNPACGRFAGRQFVSYFSNEIVLRWEI